MALEPVDISRWCEASPTAAELSAKLELLKTNYANVVQATKNSSTAQRLLADAVSKRHDASVAHAAIEQLENSGDAANEHGLLLQAALSVPEDLCVLQRTGEHYRLVAACVTAPSYWRLSDKMGKGLNAVHEEVPGLNQALGDRMDAFFERLPEGRCMLRRNWFLHSTMTRFQPEPERRTAVLTAKAAEKLIVRSETQTLLRLSDEVVAFTIAVACYPLIQIAAYPAAAASMHKALTSRNENERRAASQDSYEQGVLAFLDGCC